MMDIGFNRDRISKRTNEYLNGIFEDELFTKLSQRILYLKRKNKIYV